ncbi:hypothetical protein K432DRAFT_473528 [Lepidopterella palustris CBS 459.81]|uniref:Uncharacterized protein n=1 Tax=Lepidopterella palustris CBS 459.81 TaxID=1314670 RepID=A0A8E2EDW6_9PEZI|nr:hypothetical protein K432DRAFT_473528 [Lepidopterella palustris CBS 459.81]
MAATNAVFWTGRDSKWDGSETMMVRSRSLCTSLLSKSRIRPLSGSSFQTMIVTLQGIKAMRELIESLINDKYGLTVALPTVFFPLAVLGLFRLAAVLWLSDDYGYMDVDAREDTLETLTPSRTFSETVSYSSEARLLHLSDALMSVKRYPQYLLRTALVALLFLARLAAYLVLAASLFLPTGSNVNFFAATTFSLNLFYPYFLFLTLVIVLMHILQGHNSTVLSALDILWYKIYTFSLYILASAIMIIAALETGRTPCGYYTTLPLYLRTDSYICMKNEANFN